MDSSVSPKEEICFLRLCYYISTGLYTPMWTIQPLVAFWVNINHYSSGALSIKRLVRCWTIRVSNPGGGEIFRTHRDRPQGTQPPVKWGPGHSAAFGQGVALAIHRLLAPWSSMGRAILPTSPPVPSCDVKWQPLLPPPPPPPLLLLLLLLLFYYYYYCCTRSSSSGGGGNG
jgi:hypothetical protein